MKRSLTVAFMLKQLRKAEPAMKRHRDYVQNFPNGLEVVVQKHTEGPYSRVWIRCRPEDDRIFDQFVLAAMRHGYDVELDNEGGVPSAFFALPT